MSAGWVDMSVYRFFFWVLFYPIMRSTGKPHFYPQGPMDTSYSHSMSSLQKCLRCFQLWRVFPFRDGNEMRAKLPEPCFWKWFCSLHHRTLQLCSSNPVPMSVSKLENTWLDHQECLYQFQVQSWGWGPLPGLSPQTPHQLAKSNQPRKLPKRGQPNNKVQTVINLLLVTFVSCSKLI